MATVITVRQNGSYRVEGDVKLVDWNGNPYPTPPDGKPFALCRCGASKRKPFCDKSHLEIGFQATEAAPLPPAEEAKPAQ